METHRTFGLPLTEEQEKYFWHDPVYFLTKPTNFVWLSRLKSSGDEEKDAWINEAVKQAWVSFGSWDDGLAGAWRIMRNFPKIKSGHCYSDYEPLVEKCALICAGPSLDSQWDFIKQLPSKNIAIMACDTIVGELLANGVKPDMCFSAERVPDKIDAISPNRDETWCISAMAFAADHLDGSAFAFRGSDTFTQIYPAHNRKVSNWVGLYVSPLAMGCIMEMGFKEVWMLGQDMCFDPVTKESHSKVNLTHPGFTTKEDKWDEWRIRKAKNWKGEEVVSTSDWIGFQRNLNVIMTHIGRDRILYNLSPYGLPVLDEKRADFDELLDRLKPHEGPKLKRFKVKRKEDADGRKKEIFDAINGIDPLRNQHIKKLTYEMLLRPMADYYADVGALPKHKALFDHRWKKTLEATTDALRKVLQLEEWPNNPHSLVDTKNTYCKFGSAVRALNHEEKTSKENVVQKTS